jgi:hypothetical protein
MNSTPSLNAIILSNPLLRVEIGQPGEYAGSRFDWTGFIRQVTLLEGGHTFCSVESLTPGHGTGGAGLCNEFGIHHPIGYESAAPGGLFPKLGVGLLTRPDEGPYDFYRPYDVQPYPVEVQAGTAEVSFISEPVPCSGYAARLTKRISLNGASLTMEYELRNTGEQPIETTEYVHNFVVIDGLPVGPGYTLRLAQPLTPRDNLPPATKGLLVFDGRTITWTRALAGSDTFYCQFPGYADDDADSQYHWELVHQEAGAGLRESGTAPVRSLALWGEKHVLSPEVFIDVRVAPGGEQRWSRTYDFFTL